MTWEYGVIGVAIGMVFGALAMRFGNRRLRDRQQIQYELDKTKADLAGYRNDLTKHFVHSAEMLENMAKDYRKLYQHLVSRTDESLSTTSSKSHSDFYQGVGVETDNDRSSIEVPRDYAGDASGLLRGLSAKHE